MLQLRMFNLMNKGSLLVSPFQGRRFMSPHNSKHSDCGLLFIYNKYVTKKVLWNSLLKCVSLPGQPQSKVTLTHKCAKEPQLIPPLRLLLSPHFRKILSLAQL